MHIIGGHQTLWQWTYRIWFCLYLTGCQLSPKLRIDFLLRRSGNRKYRLCLEALPRTFPEAILLDSFIQSCIDYRLCPIDFKSRVLLPREFWTASGLFYYFSDTSEAWWNNRMKSASRIKLNVSFECQWRRWWRESIEIGWESLCRDASRDALEIKLDLNY
jgi:hypothetical protein